MARYKDEDWLRHEYREEGLTMSEIAEQCGISHQTVDYWLNKFGIEKQSRGVSGEDNPAWAGGDIEFTCAWCGSAETRPRANFSRNANRPYCSTECHYAHKSELMMGEGNHQYGVRGEENHTYGRTGEDHPLYGVRGEDAPAWKGGHDQAWRDGPQWRDTRRAALERDGRECVSCGMTREEHDEEFSRDLEAHHATPVFDGGAKFDLDNVVTLCIPCHQKRHRNYERKPTADDAA